MPNAETDLNQNVLIAIVRTVLELSYTNTVGIDSDTQLAEYGLTESRAQLFIQILLSTGEGHFIVVGAATPRRTAYYALVDDRDQIFLVGNSPDPVGFLLHYLNEYQNSG